jgi:DUF4097 and DUF4098 domain-containing protein YvlB
MTTWTPASPARAAARLPWLALLAPLALAPSAWAGTPINERAAADPAGQVEISNIAGSVVVTGWDRAEVEVTGELGKGAERLEFTRAGKLTRVKVIMPKQGSRAESSDLIVKVPAGGSVSVNTVSADVGVQGLRGAQRLQSVSGDIETQSAAEDVECKTVSGNVTVNGSGARGLLTVTTVSGDAQVDRVAGEVNGNTVSGNFTIAMGDTARSRLRSTSGDLGIRGRLTPDARLDFESISGNIRLDLDGSAAAEFDVSTFNGDIDNCFGPEPVRTSQYAPGSELRFREGAGGARVRVKTLNGDIRLCNK